MIAAAKRKRRFEQSVAGALTRGQARELIALLDNETVAAIVAGLLHDGPLCQSTAVNKSIRNDLKPYLNSRKRGTIVNWLHRPAVAAALMELFTAAGLIDRSTEFAMPCAGGNPSSPGI